MPSPVVTPMFELVGPPCEVPGCKGVLVDHISLRTKEFFRKCSVCGGEFHRVSAEEKLAWAKRLFRRVLKGEREN